MTDTFSKTVAIKAVDDDEMIATGVVMTPYELDRQLDWLDPEGVKRMHTDDPDDGVMHTSFPDGHATLEFNEVLDSPRMIDGVEFDTGEWVIRRRYKNRRRWQLVKDGILSAYSIGGEITEVEEYDSVDDLPDRVDTSQVDPAAVDERYRPPTKLVDGTVREISDVDIGAVPSAEMEVVKAAGTAEKSIFDRVEGREEFVELMGERGHDREDATQLWRYLQTNKAADEPAESGADTPTQDDMSDSDDDPEDEQTGKEAAEASDFESDGVDIDKADNETLGARLKAALGFGGDTDDPDTGEDAGTEKAGRTLSQSNRRAVMASIDAQLDMLDDAGVDHGMERFSDRADFAFNLAEYEGKGSDEMDKNAPESDISESNMSEDTDDTEKSDDAPEWAESLTEKVESIEKRVDDIEGDDTEKGLDDAPEWAQTLAEKVDDLDDRVDKVSKATATTQQTGGSETTGETDDVSKTEKQKRELFFGGN